MGKHLFSLFAIITSLAFSAPVYAGNADVEAAITLMKESHIEQCQKQKIKLQLLIAHQNHDQAKLAALGQELDDINWRLKPVESKLKALKAAMDPDDESDFQTAMLHLGCE